ncbi:ABC transporter ATP-binding protein [Flavobacterium sp. 3HN19-14]|uniref:ABC transporter ATP-binding protein n=1 Tax=Flavobacterium sp. 3HN19-14 TaxID=3448133 RepID=UPI003EE071CB
MEILKASDLSIGYSHKKQQKIIAANINLSLETGQLIALIGENGIGKSTLLRTITGIQQPLSGKVLLSERDISDYNPLELAQQLSVVLTEKLPPNNLTVYELIALGRQPYTNWIGKLTEEDISKIKTAIELTEIGHLSSKKHYEISDGQLQKVLIARAIAQDTPLIILDEPTTHLDLRHKISLLQLLKKLSLETGKCILFSTHDIEAALQICNKMVVMTSGNIVQKSPQELIASGLLNQIFADGNIIFDTEKSKFIFKTL